MSASRPLTVQFAKEERANHRLEPTIFHEEWWLDGATEGQFDVVEVTNNGKVVGRLPYVLRVKYGIKFSVPPSMTHFLGPAIDFGTENEATSSFNRIAITQQLIAKLPKTDIFRIKCHNEVTDVVAFQVLKFATSAQFTQLIAPNEQHELWRAMQKKKRSQVVRAQQTLKVIKCNDPELFWYFYQSNIELRGIKNGYRKSQVITLVNQTIVRGRGQIYIATENGTNMPVAAIWCIWDSKVFYYFMSSRIPNAHDGAVSLLIWEAIKDASKRNLIFDFDGYINKKSLDFFRGFGGVLSPRYLVTRTSLIGRFIWEARELLRDNRYFC